MKAILSIKPEFVSKIISGEKQYEFRKKIFKKDIESIIIYSTKPVGCFVGEFKFNSILSGDMEHIWSRTYSKAGISKEFFDEYFKNTETAYAISIDELLIYDNPIEPCNIIPGFTPPQSYCYIQSCPLN
jgi:predicted transcriptional regulator